MILFARSLLVVLLLVVTVTACGGDDDSTSSSAEPGVVLVKDNVFEPKEITVGVGDTVTWRFEGKSAHNVKGDAFDSELMKDGTFEHTFDEAGDYDYVCTVHTGMNGSVVVDDGSAP